MDQLKDILRQCVKYRFWIAFGVSLILPIVGYFVGVGGIIQAKTKSETEINTASKAVVQYKTPGIVNNQYQPLAAQKNAILTQDVDESWRKLRSIQEPYLRWPEEVEPIFLKWGRKYPSDVDKGEVTRTLVDFTYAYPAFVSKIYKIFNPFNYEDGTGIVVAPGEKELLRPATYSAESPPDLSKVWAEQERIWVVTALLDAVARINETVKAKDWSSAIVKEIKLVEVGAPTDQDQKSMAENIPLAPADILVAEGAPAPPPAAPPGGLAAPGGGPGLGSNIKTDEVFYLKSDSKQYKTLPIKMTVLVDQSKIPDFLVGLENSPITIQVMETEVVRPSGPVTKPEIGERSSGGMRMGDGPGPMGPMAGGPGRNMNRGPGGGGAPGVVRGPGAGGDPRNAGGPGGASTKGGTDGRSENKAKARKDAEKAAKNKNETAVKVDQYYNIVEVTVYGQARFYLAPPPKPASAPSTSAVPVAPSPTPSGTSKNEPTKSATPPAGDAGANPAPKAEAPKTEPAPGPGAPPK